MRTLQLPSNVVVLAAALGAERTGAVAVLVLTAGAEGAGALAALALTAGFALGGSEYPVSNCPMSRCQTVPRSN